jgi:hypothetical protein
MIKYVYYVPCLETILLLISTVMKHNPHLHINFNNNVMGVEEHILFWFLEVGNTRLV